jgi:ABC-type glycerol-3-phosphate transport system substrate-binding protein
MRHRHPLAVLLIVLALLSACGFDTNPSPPAAIDATSSADATAASDSAGAVTAVAEAPSSPDEIVTIGFGAQEYERQIYEPLIEEFNRQNAGLRVQFVSLDEFTRPAEGQAFDPAKMMRQIVSAADTASVYFFRAQDMRDGLLYDLKPLMDADPDFKADDFYPGVFDIAALNGATYMVPRSMRIQLLSYNKDLWAARGLPAPKPNWTWDDLIGAAQQLAHKRGANIDVYGFLDWSNGFTLLLHELSVSGINLFAQAADQTRLDRPEIAAALDRVAVLGTSGALYVKPRDPTAPVMSDEFHKLIVEQHAGMWPREMLFSGPDQDKPSFAIGTAPYPPLPQPFYGGAQGYVMSSGTQHPQEAWRWLSFLSRQEVKSPFEGPDSVGELPARKSVAERSGYWSKLDEEATAAIKTTIERPASPMPEGVFDGRLFELLSKALSAVVSGEQKADRALREAQAELDQQVAQVQSTPSPTAASGPVVVATPVVEAAPEGAAKVIFGTFGFEAEQIRRLAREFNQNNPMIFVQIKNVEPTGGPFRLADVAAGSDCFSWWGPPDKGEITATLDLQPLIDSEPSFDIADYPPALLAPFRQGSGLYGLPHAVTFRVLSYNQNAFDAAGLSYPTADWTIDDFLDAAQKLTKRNGDKDEQYGYATDGPLAQDLLFFVDRFGARITQGSGDAQKPNFTDPQMAQAIRFYLNLLRDTSPHKTFTGYKRGEAFGGELFELIREGRVGMSFEFGNTFFFIGPGNQPKYTRAIAAPPLGKGPLSPEDFRATGLFISSKTQQGQACWQWLKYMSGSASEMAGQGTFPARRSVAESDAFLKDAANGTAEVYQAYRTALERTSDSASARDPFYQSKIDYFWFFRAVDRALQGKDLERELADAQRLSEQFLGCVDGGVKPSACALQVDPSYEGWSIEQP